jgi:Right handed beta helix region
MASSGGFGGVLITTAGLHVRGMDRNATVIDGDTPGSSTPCDPAAQYQSFGSTDASGNPIGRNGIVAYQADNVSIENVTVCNFLAGSASSSSGFEIWWDGGEGSGQIGLVGYSGSYLNATSTFYKVPVKGAIDTNATYGIFANSAAGPATWDNVYASNMNDSGAYVGACQQQCNVTIDHSWFEYNALGYSGTNSGGTVVIQNSEFDHNQDGLDTNTEVSSDPPPPQDGRCPGGATSPITKTTSCWVFQNNNVHDNNNADVPAAGAAAQGPVGTGMTISGGRWNTVMNNTFTNNGAWGLLFVPYPDSGTPYAGKTCADYGGVENALFGCVLDPEGNALIGNTFSHNGFFGNATNGDYGELTLNSGEPGDCFANNTAPDGSYPTDLETTHTTCGTVTTAAETGALLGQVACDTGAEPCASGMNYPKITTNVTMRPLPTANLPTMPNPCDGVPSNPWCP